MGRTKLWKCVAAGALALLLAACGSSQPVALEAQDEYTQLVTIKLSGGETPQALEARYGGTMLDWRPEAGYALMGLKDGAASGVQAANLIGTVEPNAANFVASGVSTINGVSLWADGSSLWADGSSLWADGRSLWADGRSLWADGRSLWADGRFLFFPQNTQPLSQIRLEQAHRNAPNLGKDVKVAVIDTGIDLSHPAFAGSLVPSSEWRDFVGNDQVPQEGGNYSRPGHGHGTSVAGIVLQVAPRAKILPIRVLNSFGEGTVANVARAITYAVDRGAQVINLSLGSDTAYEAITQALIYAASRGVYVVSSAGNDDRSTPNFPARIARTSMEGNPNFYWTSVSSVNTQNARSSFANYGREVELFAPGEQIFAPAPGNMKATWSGTSQAAPLASGAIALALGERDRIRSWVPMSMVSLNMTFSSNDYQANLWMNDPLNSSGKGTLNIERFLNTVLNPLP
ncbi:MAG: S8 family serine peptidase [Meiothermus sp.]|nr:S8 family serine peptidase [Meiothermus sp.]